MYNVHCREKLSLFNSHNVIETRKGIIGITF